MTVAIQLAFAFEPAPPAGWHVADDIGVRLVRVDGLQTLTHFTLERALADVTRLEAAARAGWIPELPPADDTAAVALARVDNVIAAAQYKEQVV